MTRTTPAIPGPRFFAASPVVTGGVSWSSGPAMSEGRGGLSGATPPARCRAWIVEQAGRMGSPLPPAR
jgi:hypothetical protein